ncbi:MAG: hypothetical protein ACXW1T_09555, partial [Methylophilus sp.]
MINVNQPITVLIKRTVSLFKPNLISTLVASSSILFTACGFLQYSPKTIEPAANAARFEQKDPASEQFHQYLLNNGYAADRLPLQQWGLDDLTYCALFFNPSLNVARAQWHAAELAESVAAAKT